MKLIVAQPGVGQASKIRRRDWAAEGGRLAEAGIVEQDHQDVRCPCRSFGPLGVIRRGVGRERRNLAVKWRLRRRQDGPVRRALAEGDQGHQTQRNYERGLPNHLFTLWVTRRTSCRSIGGQTYAGR